MSEYSCISLDALTTRTDVLSNEAQRQWRFLAVSPDGVTYLVNAASMIPVDSIGSCQLQINAVETENIRDGAVTPAKFSGALPINKGGTGATTAKSAQYNLLNDMRLENNFTDEYEIVGHYATDYGNTTNGSVYKLKATTLWNWIKDKISSVLRLTASNYNGTSAKSTADGSGNNIVNTYATKTELTGKVNATNIKSKTTTDFTYYALTYGDSITDYKTEGLLIQIRRLNFVPETYLFNLSNYPNITDINKECAITKLNASPKRNDAYDTSFYLDSTTSTLYLKVASFSLLTMLDLSFRATPVPYTEVNGIPDTATQLEPITYTTKYDLESTYGLTATQYKGNSATATNAACFNSKSYDTAKNDIRSGLTGCLGTVTSVKFQCAGTDKCTVSTSGTINLSANAWNTNATISTSTYPGACCTGTITNVSGCTVSKAATLTCSYICFGTNCIWIGE